jgi:acetylornithine deacetylase/succinyl-diaminopimelate desuccinylase-like protein
MDAVLTAIDDDRESLVELALELSDLPDIAGYERPVAEAVVAWFERCGVPAFVQPISPTSANAVAVLEGAAPNATSLILTAHMDTEGILPGDDPALIRGLRGSLHLGESLVGKRIGNNKGQLVAQMIATRALHTTDTRLNGTLTLAATAQETAVPQEEPAPNAYDATREAFLRSGPHYGEGFGSRHLIDRGVVAHYALVGESTGFAVHTAQAGVLRLRLAVGGQVTYTPLLDRGAALQANPNPFEKAAHLVVALEAWAREYEAAETRALDDGLMVPKAQIHDIRTSGPLYTAQRDYCYIYMDVRLAPGREPTDVVEQVKRVVASTGIEAEVSTYDYARGYHARDADVLVQALHEAHASVLNEAMRLPAPPLFSMFTDSNRFNEAGIPAVTYGAPLQMENFSAEGYPSDQTAIAMKIDDLVNLAKIYALTVVKVCGAVP